jgi:hypothetical protein
MGIGEREPLVSVIMIFKNPAPYFDTAARSVLAQTWSNLELLLVDDGGTDGSDAVAVALAREDDRVRVLSHPGRANRGTGPSRLLAIRNARGELTAFLDGDDYWEPAHLHEEVALLQAHPEARMVCGRVRVWRSWADPDVKDTESPLPFAPNVVVAPPRLVAAVLRNGALATHTCALLAFTSDLQSCCDDLALFPSTYEDQVINTQLQLRFPAVMSGGTSAWYRQHPDSLSVAVHRSGYDRPTGPSQSSRKFLTWMDSLPELGSGQADPEVRTLLDRELEAQQLRRRGRPRATAIAALRIVTPPTLRPPLRRLLRAYLVRSLGWATSVLTPPDPRHIDGGESIRRQYFARFLARWGEDLRDGVEEITSSAALDTFQSARCLVVPSLLGELDDVQSAVRVLHERLQPGGVLLAGLPGVRPYLNGAPGLCTMHTRDSVIALFEPVFGLRNLTVEHLGNAVSATASLHSVAANELPPHRLDRRDDRYPVLITVRALKPQSAARNLEG